MVFLSYIRMQCILSSSYLQEMTPYFPISSPTCFIISGKVSSSFHPSDLALIADIINRAIDTRKYQISYANDRAAKTCPRLEVTKDFCSELHMKASDKILQVMHLKSRRNCSNPFDFCNLICSVRKYD